MTTPNKTKDVLAVLIAAANRCEYGLGVRGSIGEEGMELIAAPWTSNASTGEILIRTMAVDLNLAAAQVSPPVAYPFGRMVYVLSVADDMPFAVNIVASDEIPRWQHALPPNQS